MKAITFCSQGRLVVCHYVTAASAPHFCTVKSFPHYQYMLRKVANQGKSQYSSFCRVEQQALCHRTSINQLSSLRRCTLSLNTVLVALTHITNIVFRLAWYTLHGMHFFWYSGIGSTDVQKFDLWKLDHYLKAIKWHQLLTSALYSIVSASKHLREWQSCLYTYLTISYLWNR